MNSKKGMAIDIFRVHLARDLLLSGVRGRWVSPGRIPQTPVVVKTRRKPLKTDRLFVFQFGAKMPSFRQVILWPKTGTVWVIRCTSLPPLLRHGDCTVSIQVKSRHSASGNRKEL